MKQIPVCSLEETGELGLKLASLIKPGMLITLSGDLGAGKTTFTKALGKALGVKGTINSPTFTILKSYEMDEGWMLHHVDAYRFEGITQELGIEECFDEGVCVIEWPDYIQHALPKERLEISIQNGEEEERLFRFCPIGETYERIVEELA